MAKKKKQKKIKGKKRKIGLKLMLFLFVLVICMILFLPSTFVVVIGMLPTFVIYIFDKSDSKNKSFTVGAMNFSGVFPYLIGVWKQSGSMDLALSYLQDPVTIIVMYSAATVGYGIDWMSRLFISSIVKEKAKMRLKRIQTHKEDLIKRWGQKVDGTIPLDREGFPLDKEVGTTD
jgi:hypothetical protein